MLKTKVDNLFYGITQINQEQEFKDFQAYIQKQTIIQKRLTMFLFKIKRF